MPDLSYQLVSAGTPTAAAAGRRLTIQLCLSWDELNTFRDAWENLLLKNSANSIFLTPEWLGSWWQTFGQEKGRKLMSLVFLDQERQVMAIAPLFQESRLFPPVQLKTLRLLGAGSGDSDALDLIVRPGFECEVVEALLSWLSRNKVWDICSLETLTSASALADHLLQALSLRGWRPTREDSPNFCIDLPHTGEAYLATLDPRFRPLLMRYPRRLQSKHRVRFFRCDRLQDLPSALETLFRLHQMRWTKTGESGAFSNSM